MPRYLQRRTRRLGARTLMLGLTAPAVILVLASACGDDDSAGDNDSTDLAGTSWTLASAAIDGDDTAAAGSATLEFAADGERFAGSTGCNRFAGTYRQDGDELTMELGPVTLAACVDAALTVQETAILVHLPAVASFSSGDQLVLADSAGDTLLTYDPGLSTIEGTSWAATGVNNGSGGVESTAATGSITAEFGSDGALSGFAGCNDYNATYELSDGGGISITAISSTRKACEEPASTLEGQYLTALEKATTYTVSGDTLTLRDSAGAAQVTYVQTSG